MLTSQRVVDVILKAFKVCAASQVEKFLVESSLAIYGFSFFLNHYVESFNFS